jgi:hypothetical protein
MWAKYIEESRVNGSIYPSCPQICSPEARMAPDGPSFRTLKYEVS